MSLAFIFFINSSFFYQFHPFFRPFSGLFFNLRFFSFFIFRPLLFLPALVDKGGKTRKRKKNWGSAPFSPQTKYVRRCIRSSDRPSLSSSVCPFARVTRQCVRLSVWKSVRSSGCLLVHPTVRKSVRNVACPTSSPSLRQSGSSSGSLSVIVNLAVREAFSRLARNCHSNVVKHLYLKRI